MFRKASKYLDEWLKLKKRKPLILRGARQVGKTWLVRDMAKRNNLELIELNVEKRPEIAEHFNSNDPVKILTNLESELNCKIILNNSLLFLDEIQAKPELLPVLRWFMEEMPQLPVISAGSLLDFALKDHTFSMPVGRISYYYLEPMSFLEFILASGNRSLYMQLTDMQINEPLNDTLHKKCLELYSNYCLIGGMPGVVAEWYETNDFKRCIKVQQDIIATLRDDFNKYSKRIRTENLHKVLSSVPDQLGKKFVTSRVDASLRSGEVKNALALLTQARICHKIFHTSGNGLALGAEANEKFFKVLMVDIGLVSIQLGLSVLKLTDARDFIFKNKGSLAEQFVGQQIRVFQSALEDPALYYWQRTSGRQGEIDYIIQYGTDIIPVEVKSGAKGAMKSLHQFMFDKKLDLAVRCDHNPQTIHMMDVKTTIGDRVSYKLLSIPFYLVEVLPSLLEQI